MSSSNKFGQKSGYPAWEDYIPTQKAQTLIMCIMAAKSYQDQTAAIVDENNNFTSLGTMIFFTANGQFKDIQPNINNMPPRIQISYADGSLISRYYQFPIPGIDIKKNDFNFDTSYKIGLPDIYPSPGPTWIQALLPTHPDLTNTGPNSIIKFLPNVAQPFYNQDPNAKNIGANVFGYFTPPQPFPYDPFVIAFHCVGVAKEYSNNPLDTLQYYKWQTLLIRTKAYSGNDVDGFDLSNNGILVDKYNNPLTVMTYLNEIDTYDDSTTFGYNYRTIY